MIRINEKWIIDVDESGNYMPRVDKKKTEQIKNKDGSITERPVYGPPAGYFSNLEGALKEIVSKEFQETVMSGEINLYSAIKKLEVIRLSVMSYGHLHLDEV